MAISKLSDIIPITTMIESESIKKARRTLKKRKAKATRRKKPVVKTKNQDKGPWSIREDAWNTKFKKFLEFCGWSIDKSSAFPELLKHPTDELWFEEGLIFDEVYNALDDCVITKYTADNWLADDVNFILYKEKLIGSKLSWRAEIKLK